MPHTNRPEDASSKHRAAHIFSSSIPVPKPARSPLLVKLFNWARVKLTRRMLIALVVGLFLIAASAWVYNSRQPNSVDRQLIAHIQRTAQVPVDETPTIRIISDKSKVSQSFFSRAEDGDKLLLYPTSKIAVLYRPATQKIVNMGPVEFPPPSIFLRNGTNQKDISRVIDKLAKAPESYRLASRDTATHDYTETLVVDLTGLRGQEAEQLAGNIGGRVVDLPEGETRPEGDLLIIIGHDQFSQ